MVEVSTINSQKWVLTATAFDKLLAEFDPDREQAGEMYETARRKLVKFFEWRRCASPEEFADETINRAAHRLENGEKIENINSYLRGVARFVLLENFKEQTRHEAALDQFAYTAPATSEITLELDKTVEQESLSCLEVCLKKITSEQRNLILQYYNDDQNHKINVRKKLAQDLGLSLNALRIRAQRIRQQLEKCVKDCLCNEQS